MDRQSLMVDIDDVSLAVETFGSPLDPAVVLVMGATASMVWWPEPLCSSIAAQGYVVVRYDHRDTGRSTTGTLGEVAYSAEDLADDLLGVMDTLGLTSAHLVGMSLGGYLAQIVAVTHPERVRSLTLLASEPLGAEEGSLPGIDERFMAHFATFGELDWSDADDVERFLVEIGRLSAGTPERFDEAGTRQRVAVELERASDLAAAFNHGMVGPRQDWAGATARITQPTLVIHGALDPILPLPNGEALAHLIAGARLHVLPHAGHELNPLDLDEIISTIVGFLAEHQ